MRNARLIATVLLLSLLVAVAGSVAGSGMVTEVTQRLQTVLDNGQ